MLERIGRWCFRRRWVVLGAWLAGIVVVFASAGTIGSSFSDDNEVPESEAKVGADLIDEYYGGLGAGHAGSIVFRAPQGIDQPQVEEAMTDLFVLADAIDGVAVISPYEPGGAGQVTPEGDVAFATIELSSDLGETETGVIGNDLREAKPEIDGLEVFIGGQALAGFEPPQSELIGIAFAVVILIVAFGSVVAMGIPIGVAMVGVGTGLALTTLASNGLTVPEFALTIGAMIGLGVGIDYALFIVTRYREMLHEGMDLSQATGRAIDTAGRTVLFAGLTVVVSLLGLIVIGLSFTTGLAIAAAMTVLCTMAASITLLPALIGFAGDRIEVTRWRGAIAAGLVAVALFGIGLSIQPLILGLPLALIILLAGSFVPPLRRAVPRRAPRPLRETGWYRFSRIIQRHPWPVAIGVATLLIVLALPVLGLRLGFSDEGNAAPETDQRQAYDLLTEGFGPGFNGPLIVAVDLGDAGLDVADELTIALGAVDGVASVTGPIPNDPSSPAAALIRVTPDTAPQDEATTDLVELLRDEVIPAVVEGTGAEAAITGFTAASIDFTDYLAARTLAFFAVVLLLSFLLLMMVFRSLLVPLKAVVMNMLAIGAAYGVTVAAFQWGWLDWALDTGSGAPIEPFIPMMMFAVVFGLSMDYEVFLLSRIKEEYDRTGDAVESVADGLAVTARVITAAAAIMIVVFGSFVLEDERIVRLFGFGLATAVFLDATLVRMLLVPATMELLGERNWWIPGWLDRILPNIQIEGRRHPDDDEAPDGPSEAADREPVLTG